MDRRAFISINGATYQYAYPISGGDFDSQLQQLQEQIRRLAYESGSTQHTLKVIIDGNAADLHTTPRDVFAASAYLEAE